MIQSRASRRVHLLTGASGHYVERNNRKMKRRRGPCQVHRRPNPSKLHPYLRGNTLSIPARVQSETPTHRHLSEGAKTPRQAIDPTRLALAGAMDKGLRDRESRVYTLIALAFPESEVDVDALAGLLPLTEQQIRNSLGDLVAHGLLTRRQRVVGYNERNLRIRRYFYRVAGGAL